jgi:hypothetical protein
MFVFEQIGDGSTTRRNSPVIVGTSFFATSLWDHLAFSIESASNDPVGNEANSSVLVSLSVILPRIETGHSPDFFLFLHHLYYFYDNYP